MDWACSYYRLRGGFGAAALVIAGAILTGCSSSDSTSSLPSLPGGVSNLLASSNPEPKLVGTPNASLDEDCPTVDIRAGASTLSVATKTQQATAGDLRYQLTFTQTARQCALAGGTVRIRVGVEGRVIVGPAGAPSQVDVPVRYAVVREGIEPKTIATRFRRFPVAIPPGATNVPFTDIEEDLSFPLPSLVELQAYVLYVGFDELGDRGSRGQKSDVRGQKKR
jgi:hypothetical protein